jgi:hypothetical protein
MNLWNDVNVSILPGSVEAIDGERLLATDIVERGKQYGRLTPYPEVPVEPLARL